ncbi:MAG: SDR family oxidoreductase [Legionellales bacterium]|nr:SDR family oxidoreductase [Legionellales bacterium]
MKTYSNAKSILVTGASGFVGRALCAALLREGHQVRAVVRPHITQSVWKSHDKQMALSAAELVYIENIATNTEWSKLLEEIDVIVHLAARVHIMHETSKNPLEQFRAVNLEGTKQLAVQAAKAGVKRFIYLSTIKVNGEGNVSHAYTETDPPQPSDPYAVSKWEAEQALQKVCQDSEMQYVILRPPLIYGQGVKGNFLSLMKLVKMNAPLPLKQIHNKRSMIYLNNLVSIILCTLDHPKAANQLFLVSDGDDLSIAQLITFIAEAMGKSSKLFSLPENMLVFLAKLFQKESYLQRLTGSLQINSEKLQANLAWQAPITIKNALKETVASYLQQQVK